MTWWRGRDTVAAFAADEGCAAWRCVPTRANGQPALASYHLDAQTGRYAASALDVLAFEGSKIKEITTFVTPEIYERFGVARVLD
jgi:RNA polymerase sigma-70 factor (ECF subfamily)